LFVKADGKTLIEKIDHGPQIFRETIVELRGTRGQSTQDWVFEAGDVFSLPCDQRVSRIGA
jgi:hypothetical protein